MRYVIRIIGICLSISVIVFMGCQSEQPKKAYNFLPAEMPPPTPGFVKCLSPVAFVDSINAGVKMKLYFIEDLQPVDPSHIPFIPGITTVDLSRMHFIAETMSHADPLYLVTLYGSDSRRLSKEYSARGFNCYYLDGGSYRLANELKAGRVTISSTAGTTSSAPSTELP